MDLIQRGQRGDGEDTYTPEKTELPEEESQLVEKEPKTASNPPPPSLEMEGEDEERDAMVTEDSTESDGEMREQTVSEGEEEEEKYEDTTKREGEMREQAVDEEEEKKEKYEDTTKREGEMREQTVDEEEEEEKYEDSFVAEVRRFVQRTVETFDMVTKEELVMDAGPTLHNFRSEESCEPVHDVVLL